MRISKDNITGVILAGGRARRMGGEDKGLLMLNDKPMIEYIITAIEPQTGKLLINANRNHERYAEYQHEIVADRRRGYCGPLAGIASALKIIDTDYLLTVPCDSPFVAKDLVRRLGAALEDAAADISVAHNGVRIQPVFCLLKKKLQQSLNDCLASGERKIDRWFDRHNCVIADLSDIPATLDNVNTPEDIEHAAARLRQVK